VQLDALEARLKSQLKEASTEPPKLVPRDIGFAKQVIRAMKGHPDESGGILGTILDHEVR
jgi:hypothetical protein